MIRDDPNWHQDGAGRGNLGWSPFVKQGDSHFRGQRCEEDSQLCHHPLHLFLLSPTISPPWDVVVVVVAGDDDGADWFPSSGGAGAAYPLPS